MRRSNIPGYLVVAMSGLLACGLSAPVQAQNSDDVVRAIVHLADVVFRDGQPYYRYNNEPLITGRDRYWRPVYYRNPQSSYYGNNYYRNDPYWQGYEQNATVRCNTRGLCTKTYYDPNYDRRRNRYNRYYPR